KRKAAATEPPISFPTSPSMTSTGGGQISPWTFHWIAGLFGTAFSPRRRAVLFLRCCPSPGTLGLCSPFQRPIPTSTLYRRAPLPSRLRIWMVRPSVPFAFPPILAKARCLLGHQPELPFPFDLVVPP